MSIVLLNQSTQHEYSGFTAKQLLLKFPNAAFTTARTFQRSKILCFSHHVSRLITSSKGAIDSHHLPSEDLLQKQIRLTFSSAILSASDVIHSSEELRITIIVTFFDDKLLYISHTAALPPLPKSPITVRAQPYQRPHAELKTTAWVAERQRLEQHINDSVHEVVLFEPRSDGNFLYEGLSSNVFGLVKVNSQVILQTCREGLVLGGTIRRMVMKAAESIGIVVEEECPQISESLEALFITSTSRLVLPVGVLIDDGHEFLLNSQENEWVCKLMKRVMYLIDEESELVV
ncbi:hypothetical protein GEMRC1_002963 [Eukaryota sp. GEM-RC1]